MKHSYYSLAALLATSALSTSAQLDLTLRDVWGTVQNEQTVTYYGESTGFEFEVDLPATLNGSVAHTVNVKRYELNTVPGSQNYFCWGVCYLPTPSGDMPAWVSQDAVDMVPGTEFEGFHAFYKPMGTTGVACFRYVWYNVADENDSTWVDICFDSAVGIGEHSALNAFDVYPNPAVGQDVTLEYAFTTEATGRTLVLRDLLGNTVLTRSLSATQGRSVIGSSLLSPGVYFATLEENGNAVATRRVTIATR